MVRRVWIVFIAVAAVAIAVAPAAAAAPASPGPTCNGALVAHRQLPGVTVPDGVSCILSEVNLTGAATAGLGTSLTVDGSHLHAPALSEGVLNLASSTTDAGIAYANAVGGRVVLSHVSGAVSGTVRVKLEVIDSVLGALNTGRGATNPPSPTEPTAAVIVQDSHILDALTLSRAAGQLSTSRTDGDVTLSQLGPTSLCDLHVQGDVTLIGQQPATTTTLGGTPLYSGCTNGGTVDIDGSLDLEGNYGAVDLQSVIIEGNLTCAGNAVAPELLDVTVRGTRSGQCA
jgi:hypothetical protein